MSALLTAWLLVNVGVVLLAWRQASLADRWDADHHPDLPDTLDYYRTRTRRE